jgi:hypothetical protein
MAILPILASLKSGSFTSSLCTSVMIEAIARDDSFDPNIPSIIPTDSSAAFFFLKNKQIISRRSQSLFD